MTTQIRRKDGFSGERAIVIPRMIVETMQNDEVMSALHITDIGYYPKAWGHYRERTTPIDQHVLIYCVSGFGGFTVEGRSHPVGPGCFFVLPANQPHTYWANKEDPWTIYWIHFKGSHAASLTKGLSTPHELQPGTTSRIDNRNSLFEEILSTLDAGYDLENLRYAMSAFQYYICTLRYLRQYRASRKDESVNIIDSTIRYMKENMETKVTLADLATFAGYTPSHLSALFKSATGYSPLHYMGLLRIQKACALLDNTSLKLNQICFKIGIDDPYYFSRFFSKMMGMSPREYRHRQKI